ncbi:MAG: Capsule synthesis protein CapA [Patescibacteria group bacterium]|jgi:poly-gamma-glutamate synthesis protein (capsule biosynthesis protein)|nr:Capsule synthesis protein CapA [Patescibacteria group bacterium]
MNKHAWLLGLIVIAVTGSYLWTRNSPLDAVPEPQQEVTSTVSPQPTSSPTPVPDTSLTLTFGGDVMLGRFVEKNMKSRGASWPMAQVAETLKKSDLAIVNLESPFLEDAVSTESGSLVLRGYPAGIVNLTNSGIDLVSLANNHITDMGVKGVEETKALLDSSGIAYTGAGLTEADAAKPSIIERQGVKFGFLSYSYGVNIERAGIFYNKAEKGLIQSDVARLKPTVDVVVVLCHCGNEYETKANAAQKEWAHAAIDAGASLYVGAHPHIPQPVEKYENGLIFYSLGNLVFDQQEIGNRNRSALASVTFTGNRLSGYSLLPYQIYEYGQPRFLTDPSAKKAVWSLFGSEDGEETYEPAG